MDNVTFKLKQIQIHRLNLELQKNRDLKMEYIKKYNYKEAEKCTYNCRKIIDTIIKLRNDMEIFKYRFYKDISDKWFIDIPNYTGSKDDLELIMGADTILDIISDGENELILYLSEKQFINSSCLSFVSNATDIGEGAYYKLNTYNGFNIEHDIWLCDVTKFVFGHFPINICFIQLH